MAEHPPVASLPMYDWPEVQWAHDALWSAIAERLSARGIAAPEKLDRHRDQEEVWTDPGLVLSQTCAWPYITQLTNTVRLVGTPEYDVEGCADSLYSSFLVTRGDEAGDSLAAFRGRRFAINGRNSLSGFIALRSAMHAEGLAEHEVSWIETGAHRESIRAVADGRADLAAIDAVCWALAGRHETGAVAKLRIVNRTPLRPGLPMVTAGAAGDAAVETIRNALTDVLASDETLPARQALFLAAVDATDAADYAPLIHLATL